MPLPHDLSSCAGQNGQKHHLEATWQRRVAKQLLTLTTDPRPSGVTKLRGVENEWRIRIGDYRVIYEIDDEKRMVTVLRIRHRREVYR